MAFTVSLPECRRLLGYTMGFGGTATALVYHPRYHRPQPLPVRLTAVECRQIHTNRTAPTQSHIRPPSFCSSLDELTDL